MIVICPTPITGRLNNSTDAAAVSRDEARDEMRTKLTTCAEQGHALPVVRLEHKGCCSS